MTHNLYLGRQKWQRPLVEGQAASFQEVASRALITHGERILLVWQSNMDSWWLPGGRIKPGEDLRLGVMREIEEETALDCELGDMVGFFDVLSPERRKNTNKHMFHFIFHATPKQTPDYAQRDHIDTDADLAGPGDVTKIGWFTVDEVRALPRVFPDFLRDWPDLMAPHPKAYYGTKVQEGAPENFEMHKFRISTRALTTRQDSVLMITAPHWGYYCLPGGMVEYEEAPLEAARREVQEETGLKVEALGIVAVDEFFNYDHGNHGINLYTHCTADNPSVQAEWLDGDGGLTVHPTFVSRQQLGTLPRAYPLYLAELAWPNTVS